MPVYEDFPNTLIDETTVLPDASIQAVLDLQNQFSGELVCRVATDSQTARGCRAEMFRLEPDEAPPPADPTGPPVMPSFRLNVPMAGGLAASETRYSPIVALETGRWLVRLTNQSTAPLRVEASWR